MPFDARTRLNWTDDAHHYQQAGAAHLHARRSAMLWLSPGYGKTSIVLHTFKALVDAGRAKNMLVIAPLRVVQTVWAQEIEGWASLHGLRACRLHGSKKDQWLKRRDVNVWLLNYEGIPWLAKLAKEGKLPVEFDVVVADEVRRFKNSQGTRFKAARPLFKVANYRWGLTGTPASNGLMDLFGQFLMIDDGESLGNRITRFRHDYFEVGFDGFTYLPRPGTSERIEARVKDKVFRADGFLDLPEFVYDNRVITLDDKARKTYNAMKQELVASLEGTTITAANAAVLTGKLKQMANGRVYDEHRGIHKVHDAKADALRELVDELGDEQLLIAYEYQHDLDQIREVLGDNLPYIGAGVNETTMQKNVAAWNAREIQIMAAHPASAGHGINLQKGGAHHILWWGPTFDLDHYIQFNDRLRRQGNTADSVVVHTFITERSVDEQAAKSRDKKESRQSALLSALTAELGITTIQPTTEKENQVTQLQFKSDAQQPAQPAQGGNPFQQAQPAQGGNPFQQAQPAQQPAQPAQGGNLFQQAQPAQPAQGGNTFQQAQPAQGGNTFQQAQPAQPAQGGNPFQQQAAIRQDVGHAPPPTPNQAFAAYGVAMGAENPTQPASGQFSGGSHDGTGFGHPPAQPNITANPEDRRPPVEDALVAQGSGWANPVEDALVAQDSGWANPESGRNMVASIGDEVPTISATGPDGMVPLYTFVPADKLDKVLSAIGRAVK